MPDPTQILRFLEARFGAEVPNVCAWRRATVGDLTSSFNIAVPTIQFRICRPPLRQFRRSSSNVRQIGRHHARSGAESAKPAVARSWHTA